MQRNDAQIHERYFKELSFVLNRKGFSVREQEDGNLSLSLNGEPVGTARFHGITYPAEGTASAPREAQEKAWSVIRTVSEYMRLMESAPLLEAEALEGDYRILAQFSDTVLAGRNTSCGVQFVTWEWNRDHTALSHGCYVLGEYETAKRDFAARSALVPQEIFFMSEQFRIRDLCCASALAHDSTLTFEQEQLITEIREQLREIEPGLKSPEQDYSGQVVQQNQIM